MSEHCYRLPLEDSDKIAYYQLDILQKTTVSPLVKTQVGADGDGVYILPDIAGMLSFKEYCAIQGLTRQTAIKLIIHLLKTAGWCSDHLLDPVCLSISPGAFYRFSEMSLLEIDQIVFIYIPVRDPDVEIRSAGLCGIIAEKISGNSIASLFSKKELGTIAEIDLYDTETGIRTIMAFPDAAASDEESENHVFPEMPFFLRILRFNPGIRFTLVSILSAQFILLLLIYTLLRNTSSFADPLIPVMIASVIILLIAAADIVLFLHRASPLKQIVQTGRSHQKKEEKELFSVKEEKTTLLAMDGQNSRIAMICSGMPGTAEDNSGQKMYILVDDFLIGRDRTRVDFRIDSISIGRVHARIIRRHNSFFMEDLDSINGTYIDKRKLKKNSEYLLPDKCRIRFAGQEYFFIAS
ncbi:MAG: FHA domain-containing protein [Saccharofermentanales bacterium]